MTRKQECWLSEHGRCNKHGLRIHLKATRGRNLGDGESLEFSWEQLPLSSAFVDDRKSGSVDLVHEMCSENSDNALERPCLQALPRPAPKLSAHSESELRTRFFHAAVKAMPGVAALDTHERPEGGFVRCFVRAEFFR